MAEELHKVAPGDPLSISAAGWNQIVDAVRQQRADGPRPRGAVPPPSADRPVLVVRVKASGTLPIRGIVTLGAALIDPDTDPFEANATPFFEAEAPVAGEVPAVLLQPLAAGEVGRAVVQGVCVASVAISSAAHEYAAPVAGDVFSLASATSGPFRLLTRPGTGTHTCLVLLGAVAAEEAGTGGCAGCGWVAGLTDLDCLLASVVERLGRCDCDSCAATTTSARYPTAATSTAGTGAFSEWNNTMGVFAAGEDEIAGCGLQAGEVSGDLKATGFGFSIPTGATVLGVTVSVGRGDNMDPPRATDHTVKLLKAGTAVGTNKASGGTWPTALTEATYGGAADLWGTTWTPAEINASTFGVSFTAQHAGASGESAPYLDWIRVTVTYEECETVNDGPVYLTSGDGSDWTATGTGSTVTICGVEYALAFSKEGCDGPCLTLTAEAGSGTAYTTVRDCCGPNYAIFSIGTPLVCTGTTDPDAGPVGNVARIKVEWTCCPAEGYAGPGYYCVRDAGTEGACAAVEVTSAADVCADVIEICSGPYATLGEAEGVCGPAATPAASCTAAGLSTLGQRMVSSGAFDDYYRFAVAPGAYRVVVDSTTYLTIGVTVFGGTGSPCATEQLLGFSQGSTSNVCLDFTVPDGYTCLCVRITNGIGPSDGTSQLRILSGACP